MMKIHSANKSLNLSVIIRMEHILEEDSSESRKVIG